jgi:hypothetical protein
MKNKVNFRRRSPSEVFRHHGRAGERRDLEAYVSDFSPTSILITPDRVYYGRHGLRKWVLEFWERLQDGKFTVLTETRTRNVIFVRYNCMAKQYSIPDGVATFIVRNGYFSVLTNNYTLTPRGRRKKA